MRIVFLLMLFVGIGGAAAAQGGPPAARPHPDLPGNCEGNSLRLDVVSDVARAAEPNKVTIAIARLGREEKSKEFNRRRLYTVRAYLTAMGLPPERLITAEGDRARTSWYGGVELYVGGELVDVLLAKPRGDLPVGICDNDLEDRQRYQLPRRRNTRQTP